MASENEFVRKDVYEADQRALMSEIKLGNAEILKRFDQIAIELNGKIEKINTDLNNKIDKVNADLNSKIDKVNADLNSRIDKFETQVNSRFDKLEARVEIIDANVQYLNKRLDDTQLYMSWILALIGILVAVAVVAVPYFFRKIFKPSITLEQVEELINTKIEQAFRTHSLSVS